MRKLMTLIFLFSVFQGGSQDIDKEILLEKIHALQLQSDTFYRPGMFRSQRYLRNPEKAKEDNNIFFSALVGFTLQTIRYDFDEEAKAKIDSIVAAVASNYSCYRNRQGDVTYNFWQTHPDLPFPNSPWLSRQKRFHLADDFDDTSIIYLTKNQNDSIDRLVRNKMALFTNKNKGGLKSILKPYRNYDAYTTWFGPKMKDFDMCVLANTLTYLADRDFSWNHADSASFNMLSKMVADKVHLTHPHLVSPHYQNSAVILYHLARLIAFAGPRIPLGFRFAVISDIQNLLHENIHSFERMLLLSSLYRLHIRPEIILPDETITFQRFSFFVANPFSLNRLFIKQLIGKSRFLQFNYRSEAYYWTLVLEYLVLKENAVI